MATVASTPVSTSSKVLRVLNTVLSLGFNLLIARLGLDPRWRYLLWGAIAANELRGLAVIYQVGSAGIHAAVRAGTF